MGLVLQGEKGEELPERLIGCIGIQKVDLKAFCTDEHLL